MNRPHDKPPDEDTSQILTELEDAVARQLDLAVHEDLDALAAMEQTVLDLLGRLKRRGEPASGEPAERLKHIDQLHRRACLTIAQRKQESAERLAQARDGKTALRAYGRRK